VRDAGSRVHEVETQAFPLATDEKAKTRRAATAMLDGVARELARRGHDFRLIDEREAYLHCPGARLLSYADHVVGGGELVGLIPGDFQPHCLPTAPCRAR